MEKITSRQNRLCAHIKKLGISSSYRKECGEFVCDGFKLLEEAVKSKIAIPAVLSSVKLPVTLPCDTRLCYTDRAVIDSISPLKNPQDVLFTCSMNDARNDTIDDLLTEPFGTHILLDSVQDPGNVGAIIRTAFAFGMKSVMLTGGCADLYNPKTIRATMGAVFKQRIHHITGAELAALKNKEVRIIGATLADAGSSIINTDLSSSIIAIGNEGSGLSDFILALCDEKMAIPINPECESLNVAIAAGIIMWKARCAHVIS